MFFCMFTRGYAQYDATNMKDILWSNGIYSDLMGYSWDIPVGYVPRNIR